MWKSGIILLLLVTVWIAVISAEDASKGKGRLEPIPEEDGKKLGQNGDISPTTRSTSNTKAPIGKRQAYSRTRYSSAGWGGRYRDGYGPYGGRYYGRGPSPYRPLYGTGFYGPRSRPISYTRPLISVGR